MKIKSKVIAVINSSILNRIFFVHNGSLRVGAILLASVITIIFNMWPKSREYNHWLLIPNFLGSWMVGIILIFLFFAAINFFIWIMSRMEKLGFLKLKKQSQRTDMQQKGFEWPQLLLDKKSRKVIGISLFLIGLVLGISSWLISGHSNGLIQIHNNVVVPIVCVFWGFAFFLLFSKY